VIALRLHTSEDYHWYRHDHDGHWSSKHGTQQADNVDGQGKIITDPESCWTDYGSIFYYEWGGYFAVPPKMQVQ
jgi:hypothetical protein